MTASLAGPRTTVALALLQSKSGASQLDRFGDPTIVAVAAVPFTGETSSAVKVVCRLAVPAPVRMRSSPLTPVIAQEVLQGAADEREFALLDEYLTSQTMLLPRDPIGTHRDAARLYFDCRRRGFTPLSTVDCLIAQIALEHAVPLLHDDRDFERIAKVAPHLEFA